MSDLENYLSEKNITLLDYTDFSALKPSHYVDGDHLTEKGRAIFTKQIAKDLKKELNLTVAEEFKKKKKGEQ